MKTHTPWKVFTYGLCTFRLRAEYGLVQHGNQTPYFSITATEESRRHDKWRLESVGCLHEEIVRQFPGQFTDLIALHLSDVNGEPMYAYDNGLYWLAGALATPENPEQLGMIYHGANGSEACPPEQSLHTLAKHLRITENAARQLVEDVRPLASDAAKSYFAGFIQAERRRWKAEADAAIAKHNLTVTRE